MSEEYKIKKNVPFPSRKGRQYPFAQMKIGDCFDIDISKMAKKEVENTRGAAWTTAKNNGFKVITQIKAGTLRIWLKEIYRK